MKEVLAESDQLKKSISKLTNSFRGDSLTAFSNINTGFSIDETKVLEKQFSNFTEYVFIIKRPENLNHKLENYVQRIYHNDSISQYLVEYAILEQNDVIFLDFNNIKVTLLDEPSMIIPFSSGCLPEFEDVEVCMTIPCTGTDNNNNNIYHYSSHECDCNEPGVPCSPPTTTCETFTVLVEDGCDGGGNTNSTETEPNPPVPPLRGNTSGTGNQSGSTLNTGLTPNSRTLLSAATRDFIEALPPNQKEWLESLNCDQFALIDTTDCDQELYDDIVEFLNGNTENGQVTAEAQTFFDVAVQELQNNPDAEVDWEDKLVIDPSFKNNQKAKCVYDKIKNINGTVFKNLLSNFDNSNNALLRLKVDNIPQNSSGLPENARTLPRSNGTNLRQFEIILDQNFVDNSSLMEIALALVHEMIHAEIMERCISLGIISALNYNNNWETLVIFSNGTIISTSLNDVLYANMISTYSNYQGPTSGNSSNWQHEAFNVAGYRESIANNLSQMHQTLDDFSDPFENNLNNGTLIPLTMDEYFDLMSWGGLQGTSEYNILSDFEKTKINLAFSQTSAYYNDNCD